MAPLEVERTADGLCLREGNTFWVLPLPSAKAALVWAAAGVVVRGPDGPGRARAMEILSGPEGPAVVLAAAILARALEALRRE